MRYSAALPVTRFALWSFASKLMLAFGAIALLPVLEWQGFRAGEDNGEPALRRSACCIGQLVATPIKKNA